MIKHKSKKARKIFYKTRAKGGVNTVGQPPERPTLLLYLVVPPWK